MKDFTATRRSTLKFLAAGTGVLAAPAIIRPAFSQSKVVNITTYDKFVPQSFIDQFQKDTGIEVRIRLTDDQGKQYNVLSAEGETPSTDIVTVTGHRLSQFIGSKLLTPLDTGRLKNWDKLASAYKGAPQLTVDSSVYGVPLFGGLRGPRPQHGLYQGLRQLGHHVRSGIQGPDVLHHFRLPPDHHALSGQ